MTSVKRFLVTDPAERDEALEAATLAVRRGELVVLPTDTVYGIGADAFDPAAVRRLLAAKGRGREMPPPVLIGAASTIDALAIEIPAWVRALTAEFWPGALTIVLRQQQSLQWDLGDTRGTVAVRMPDDEVAIALLERTGPLAVSSANLTGHPAATDADAAEEMLGSEITVLLDGGPSAGSEPSTIIAATDPDAPRLLRLGALGLEQLNAVIAPLGVTIPSDDGLDED
ncbi:L-threonylcarbamoyladenylate synthase [Nocardioides jiangxiensis]|uniref:L-threonylcarbamoyladenylate synthase n=1 Tax=Nocardioides jiangxiensis TaxID=3064524 RepID=A0ABT9AXX1_9ACTN|nr:L-threonylcarbamoyladenylate synthase [Nocardioides sp. WY-20]MDO7867324.1 L-threonylcarbamoyladenylate synthase [Nocardioides sp. WY-20]